MDARKRAHFARLLGQERQRRSDTLDRIAATSGILASVGQFTGSFLALYPHFFDGLYPDGNLLEHLDRLTSCR